MGLFDVGFHAESDINGAKVSAIDAPVLTGRETLTLAKVHKRQRVSAAIFLSFLPFSEALLS